MAETKAKELESLSKDELVEKYETLKKELFNLRQQAKLQKLTDVSRIQKTRRLIAKVLTIKRSQEIKK